MSAAIRINKDCFKSIASTIAILPPETGGMLGYKQNNHICAFVFDSNSKSSEEFYIPNVGFLNAKLIEWRKKSISFGGFIHSHLRDRKLLSNSDIEYSVKVMSSLNIDKILMIVVDTDTYNYGITPYEITYKKKISVKKIRLIISD